MVKNFNTNTDNNDEWLTPPEIIHALGEFDLDPCSPSKRPWHTAKAHYSLPDNGLLAPWRGRVWLNPPYGRETFEWIEKLSLHEEGGIALIFARTETKGFHRFIWQRAHSVFFFEGRLSFYYVTGVKAGAANAPSCLVSFTAQDSEAIKNSKLKGKQVFLNNFSDRTNLDL